MYKRQQEIRTLKEELKKQTQAIKEAKDKLQEQRVCGIAFSAYLCLSRLFLACREHYLIMSACGHTCIEAGTESG